MSGPLLLGFGEMDSDEEEFTPVLSRRSKKALRSASEVKVRKLQVEESTGSRREQSKSSVASVKVHNNHPLSDVMAGSRVKKKNPKYL
jgi:hypothetical protein